MWLWLSLKCGQLPTASPGITNIHFADFREHMKQGINSQQLWKKKKAWHEIKWLKKNIFIGYGTLRSQKKPCVQFKHAWWYELLRRFQTLLHFCSTPKSSHPSTTKKTKTLKKTEKKHWVHLALLHVKNARSNLCENSLTSLVIVNQEHVYWCEKKPTTGITKREREKKKRVRSWLTLSAFQSGEI